jgi:hypothetical protein
VSNSQSHPRRAANQKRAAKLNRAASRIIVLADLGVEQPSPPPEAVQVMSVGAVYEGVNELILGKYPPF